MTLPGLKYPATLVLKQQTTTPATIEADGKNHVDSAKWLM